MKMKKRLKTTETTADLIWKMMNWEVEEEFVPSPMVVEEEDEEETEEDSIQRLHADWRVTFY